MIALLVLREKVIKSGLSGAGKLMPGPEPKFISQLDRHILDGFRVSNCIVNTQKRDHPYLTCIIIFHTMLLVSFRKRYCSYPPYESSIVVSIHLSWVKNQRCAHLEHESNCSRSRLRLQTHPNEFRSEGVPLHVSLREHFSPVWPPSPDFHRRASRNRELLKLNFGAIFSSQEITLPYESIIDIQVDHI